MSEPLKELKKRLKNKSQKDLAKELGISTSYLHDILHGRRSIDKVAEKLGYKKKVTYEKS